VVLSKQDPDFCREHDCVGRFSTVWCFSRIHTMREFYCKVRSAFPVGRAQGGFIRIPSRAYSFFK
jgi:hypothetical protein